MTENDPLRAEIQRFLTIAVDDGDPFALFNLLRLKNGANFDDLT